MSSPSKARRPTAEMRVADEMALVMLARDADNDPLLDGWREKALGGVTYTEAVEGILPSVNISVRISRALSAAAARVAADHGVTRSRYMERAIAEAVARDTGDDVDTLLMRRRLT